MAVLLSKILDARPSVPSLSCSFKENRPNNRLAPKLRLAPLWVFLYPFLITEKEFRNTTAISPSNSEVFLPFFGATRTLFDTSADVCTE